MLTKHRVGCLIKRKKNFYLRWVVDGKVFSKALRDANGKAVTVREEAEKIRAREMAVFKVADQVSALESVAGRLEGRKAELARLTDEQCPPLAIEQAWTTYIDSPNRPDTGPDTLAVYQGQFGQFVKWMGQTHPNVAALRDVTADIAEAYAGQLNKIGLSPNTFNKHVRVLELAFRVLKRKARLGENPWESIQRKKLKTASRRELTLEELKKVCTAATGEFRVLFALGVYTGLRLKDCVGLRWGEVDLQRGLIRRVPSKTARRNPKPVIIPIHASLRAILADVTRAAKDGYVLPDTAKQYLAGGTGKKQMIDRIQGLFASQGIRVHKEGTGSAAKEEDEAAQEDANGEQAGKAEKPKAAKKRAVVEVGFHSLRHTFVSLCRESNAPLAVVESIVGHSNPAMTRHYTHVGELAAGQAVAALPYVVGNGNGNGEPAQKKAAGSVLECVRRILEGMTASNWGQGRAEAVAMLSAAAGVSLPEKVANN